VKKIQPAHNFSLDTMNTVWVCKEKIFFHFGFRFFCDWRHKWSRFLTIFACWYLTWAQLLDRSISLKFSLETYNKSYMNKISPAFSGFVDML